MTPRSLLSIPRLITGPALLWGLVELLALSRASLKASWRAWMRRR